MAGRHASQGPLRVPRVAGSRGEPTLTSLGGAGAMLFPPTGSGRSVLCDFFADAPGLSGRMPESMDFFAVELY